MKGVLYCSVAANGTWYIFRRDTSIHIYAGEVLLSYNGRCRYVGSFPRNYFETQKMVEL